MKTLVLFLMSLFSAVVTFADELPDTPKPKVNFEGSKFEYSKVKPVVKVPEHSKRNFVIESLVLAGLYSADYALTANGVHHAGCSYSFHQKKTICFGTTEEATTWLYGRYPSDKRLALTGAAIFVGESFLLYKTEHSRVKAIRWSGRALFGASVGMEARVIHNWTAN